MVPRVSSDCCYGRVNDVITYSNQLSVLFWGEYVGDGLVSEYDSPIYCT